MVSGEVAIKVSPRAGVSSEGSVGKNLLPGSLSLLAGFSISRAMGPRALVLWWLLAGGHPQFLAM